jgi:RimJ/RimL family protein N-acetyltransferase
MAINFALCRDPALVSLVSFRIWHLLDLRRVKNDKASGRESFSSLTPYSIVETLFWVNEKHKEPFFKVILNGRKVVGFVQILRRDGYLWLGIRIPKPYQGLGIGTKSLFLMLKSGKLDSSNLRIMVSDGNLKALALYRKFGFREVQTNTIEYQGEKQDVLIMCR